VIAVAGTALMSGSARGGAPAGAALSMVVVSPSRVRSSAPSAERSSIEAVRPAPWSRSRTTRCAPDAAANARRVATASAWTSSATLAWWHRTS
jgi:hypothetical protein